MIRIAIRRTGAAILGCALLLPAGTLQTAWASEGAPASAEAPMVGVLQLAGNNVSEAEARALTDRLRVELFETGRFTVLERERMEEILREQGFQLSAICDEVTCLAAAGKLLPVESMIGGSVSHVGTVYSLSLRRVDVRTGKVIQTDTDDSESPIGDVLTKAVRRAARRLAGLPEVGSSPAAPRGADALSAKPARETEPRPAPAGAGPTRPIRRPLFRLGIGFAETEAEETPALNSDSMAPYIEFGTNWRPRGPRGAWELFLRVTGQQWEWDASYGRVQLSASPVVLGSAFHLLPARRWHPFGELGLGIVSVGHLIDWEGGDRRATLEAPGFLVGLGVCRSWGNGRDLRFTLRGLRTHITDRDFLGPAPETTLMLYSFGFSVGL